MKAKALRDEVAFMQAVKVLLTKRTSARRRTTQPRMQRFAKSSIKRW
jgi:hypothetical protein